MRRASAWSRDRVPRGTAIWANTIMLTGMSTRRCEEQALWTDIYRHRPHTVLFFFDVVACFFFCAVYMFIV